MKSWNEAREYAIAMLGMDDAEAEAYADEQVATSDDRREAFPSELDDDPEGDA